MSAALTIVASAVVAGVVAAAVTGPILRRLPEPLEELAAEKAEHERVAAARAEGVKAPKLTAPPVEDEKVPYALLATTTTATWCGVLAAVGGAVAGWRIGAHPALAAWLLLSVAGGLLTVVDLRTRFLPSAIVWPTYGLVAVALAVAAAVTGHWSWLGRAGLCGLVTFVVFWLLWRILPRGVGFGDVRLSGLLGGALGWVGVPVAVIGVYGGFLLGAVIGGLLALAKVFDAKAYPYGPFMILGAFAGLAVAPLVSGLSFG